MVAGFLSSRRGRRIALVSGVLTLVMLAAAGILWPRSGPASANPVTGMAAVAAGESHTCFLSAAGGVMCSGAGFGTTPVGVPGLAEGVAAITAGFQHSCFLTDGGGVKCSGGDFGAEPVDVAGVTGDVVAVAAGGYHTCAVTTAGGLKCWGRNDMGQLGDGTTHWTTAAVDVLGLASGVAAVAAGHRHTCAVTTSGDIKCWGRNAYGQLGNETSEMCGGQFCSTVPVDVASLASDAAAVAAGHEHSCALTALGGVKCWGHGYGPSPQDVAGLSEDVVAVSSIYAHTCALTVTGGAKCWGDNVWGQIGDAMACGVVCPVPVDVPGLDSGVVDLSAGAFHTCAVSAVGTAACWGINATGQLGDGTTMNRVGPVQVVEVGPKPDPTSTPCPPGGCPTPTATPTGPPLGILDFSIAVDVDGDGVSDCSTKSGEPTLCSILVDSAFTLEANLDSLSTAVPEWVGFDARVTYAGVTSKDAALVVWPECSFPSTFYTDGWYAFGCQIFAGRHPTTYTGPLGTNVLNCTEDGTITLVHSPSDTGLYDASIGFHYETSGSLDTLTIRCMQPALDTDQDRCTNGQELGADETDGGRRNPLNPWDYFNPTGDGQNRVDDVLDVLGRYYTHNGDPDYSQEADRTLLGPDPWDLGPPNGRILVDDVLHAVKSYMHDCP